jgi:alpha-ketoglutarate-dependent taurine dioxygenase
MNHLPATSPATPMSLVQATPGQPLVQADPALLTARLRESGAVLLRGFKCSLEEFQQFTELLCTDFHQVGTRRAVEDPRSDGRTSEVPRSNFNLFAHSEGTYRPFPPPPEICFFNCIEPPTAAGGETLLVDGAALLQRLPAALAARFSEQGILYEALWDAQRWHTEFQLDTLQALDNMLRDHPQSSYRMVEEMMEVRCLVPAIQLSLGGLPAFANGLLAHLPAITHPRWRDKGAYSKASNRVFFGDGEPIPEETINLLIDLQDEIARDHAWQAGDLLVLDNRRVMHGRRMTEGTSDRQIRSRFGKLRNELRLEAKDQL